MTDLLPLPEHDGWIGANDIDPDSGAEGWASDSVQAYARACVEHALAAQPAGVSDEVRKLIGRIDQFRMCMSYNESYFGEPAGLLKGVFAELARAVSPIYPCGKTALYPDLVPADRIMIYESEGEGVSFAAALSARAALTGATK